MSCHREGNKMSLKRQDSEGNYRVVDPRTGEFIDEYPLGNPLGQAEHQNTFTNRFNVVDHDDDKGDIVEENGLIVPSEDEAKIKAFIKNAISIDNFIETFNDNSHETLLKLLALQDNKHPLKKGGVGIAYRTDALIMHCKMEFSAEENVVFDAILGTMSSFPENKSYKIAPTDFLKLAKYENPKSLYRTFQKGTKKLQDRHLIFDELGPDGKDDIVVPWFNVLRYHNGNDENPAFIEFVPSDFFKDLALCSQLVYGAYGALEVTTQLRGKYTIAMYWYLENRKNYRAYPSATPGVFSLSLEEMKHQFSIPESYRRVDIERRVLEPAKESINSVPECDFTFEYSVSKDAGSVVGYTFKVTNKNYIDTTAYEILEIEDNEKEPMVEELRMLANITKLDFTDDELIRISKAAKRNNKDSTDMMQILPAFKQRMEKAGLEPIEDKVGYLCRMIEQGVSLSSKQSKASNNKNGFNNFEQRDYDMAELEKKLLNRE